MLVLKNFKNIIVMYFQLKYIFKKISHTALLNTLLIVTFHLSLNPFVMAWNTFNNFFSH